MQIGTETGSIVNWMMSGDSQCEPQVGMGCTILSWTDRKAATIIKVTKCQVHVQRDRAVRVDDNGMSECQEYEFSPDPDGAVTVFRKTKSGWKSSGLGLSIGSRSEYHDYSF